MGSRPGDNLALSWAQPVPERAYHANFQIRHQSGQQSSAAAGTRKLDQLPARVILNFFVQIGRENEYDVAPGKLLRRELSLSRECGS